MPFLTTVIPVYNGELFLAPALQCLADQERKPDRVVVIDNCSTDRTPQIVEDFQKCLPLEFRRNETNIGSAGNLNRCLDLASETEYLHLLLADDLVKPGFYQRLLRELEPFPGRALAFTNYELIDRDGKLIDTHLVASTTAQSRRLSLNEFLERQSELRSVCCPAVLHKTNYQPNPSYFKTDMPQVADTVMYSGWAQACEGIVEVGEILCQNRHHPFSATSTNIRSVKATALDEWKAMWLIFDMIREPALQHRLRRLKLKCLFAARSQVKKQFMGRLNPEIPREIDLALQSLLSGPYRQIGKLAVFLRDSALRLKGQPTKAEDLVRIYAHAKKN